MLKLLIQDFLILWTTIDPIGTVAIFAGLTAHQTKQERRRIARKATFYAFMVLFSSIVLGQIILAGMGIKLISLQLAGGIILFLFGLKMIYGSNFTTASKEGEEGHDIAVFPLAIPSIATPGAIMAVILLTDNNVYTIGEQAITAGVMAFVLFLTYVMMLLSEHIIQLIGRSGALIMVKVMGMLLAALSVELIMDALGAERWLLPGDTPLA
jgi:multiple antibiotic resistance protein